jgi:flagellar basal-body rod protein FlgB
MPISDIPIFSMLRTKMQWHQERQRLLAENVANADTANFRPRDLTPLTFDRSAPSAQTGGPVALATTQPGHIAGSATSRFADRGVGYEVRPAGNSVNLEDEMMKVAANQMDFQAATSLYSRSMGLLRTAMGRR